MPRTKQKPYSKLWVDGREMFSGGRFQLWLGQDHLLLSEETGYGKTFRRFELHDIRAIAWRKNSYLILLLALFFAIYALLFMILMAGLKSPGWVLLYTSPLLIAAIVLGIGGPFCCVTIDTGIQSTKIARRVRVSKAKKAFARIRPLIEAAQSRPSADPAPVSSIPPIPAMPEPAP